jgi:CRP/FNR family nitrogen fixation transcriptional regulator
MLHWRTETQTIGPPGLGILARSAESSPAGQLISLMGACMNFHRDSEIFAEDEPAEYVYKVVRGAVRLSKLMSDGRRQISAFYLPGDIFGLEAGEIHFFSAEAIGETKILVVKRGALIAEAARNGQILHRLWSYTSEHLQRAQTHMLVLGRKNAQERIAAFLVDMAERLNSAHSVELPMSRQDIADYLGLTIETVSRTLTQLARDGVIDIPVSRRIMLRNRASLDEMNDTWDA